MFDHIFENRDKKVTNIIKLSDYLGRSLRENVEIFSIDDTENKVTFITEGGKIIAGSYDFDTSIKLKNIQIEDGDLFEDSKQFDEFVNYKISNFIENIFEEDFVEADTSFNKVLQLWESRVKFSTVKKKLYEKSQKFNGSTRILETEEFQKLVEIAPQLVTFLQENKNLVTIPEIKNMIKLSSSVAKAFNLPRLSYDDLHESEYAIPAGVDHTLYEMICKQELVRKELVESKNNFDLIWLNNDKISALAGLVYEGDEEVIAKSLVTAICEVPYLALATKKQITDTVMNNLALNETIKVNIKDIKAYSSLLFEYKKPLKRLFVSMLNEKYGISVQNLKDIPTFKSLLNTQVLIFEALAKLSPKGSLIKEILSEAGQSLKSKNGVESIDVNHFIELLFEKAGYIDILDESSLLDDISIKETFSEIDSIDELVDIILAKVNETESRKESKLTKTARLKRAAAEEAAKKADDDDDDDDEAKATEKRRTTGGGEAEQYGAQHAETELEEEPRVDEKDDENPPAVAEEPPQEQEEEPQEDEKEVPSSDEIMSSFKSFEDILNSLDFDDTQSGEEEAEEETEEAEKEAEVDKKEEGEE